MKCLIVTHNGNRNLKQVKAPNGMESLLFQEAVNRFGDTDYALDLWAVPYTDSFINKVGDWKNTDTLLKKDINGEPLLDTILSFVNNTTSRDTITLNEAVTYKNILQEGQSTEQLLQILKKAFYTDKGFTINKSNLENTGLYTKEEITNILNITEIQNNIKESLQVLNRNISTSDISLLTPQEDVSFNVEDKSIIDNLGKYGKITKKDYFNELLKLNTTSQTIDEFKVNSSKISNTAVANNIADNSEFAEHLFKEVKQYKQIPSFQDIPGIGIDNTVIGNKAQELLQTLNLFQSSADLSVARYQLNQVPSEVWNISTGEVADLLKSIEIESANLGLDLSGLSDKINQYSREDLLNFIDYVDNFFISNEYGTTTETDIYDLASVVEGFMRPGEETSFVFETLPSELMDKPIVKVDSNKSEDELYLTHGLVKISGDFYQRVEPNYDFNTTINQVYEVVVKDASVVPNEVFTDFGLDKDGKVDLKKIMNPLNKGKVITSMTNFFNSKEVVTKNNIDSDIIRELNVFKTLLGSSDKVQAPEDYSSFKIKERTFNGDFEYLTSDFISDVHRTKLMHKIMNTGLYENVLQFLDITPKGIKVNPLFLDEFTSNMELLNTGGKESDLFNNLQDYARINKETNIPLVYNEDVTEEISDESTKRNYLINNLDNIQKYKGEYIKTSDYSVVAPYTGEFIKVENNLFELTNELEGVGHYSLVPVVNDSNYYNYENNNVIVEPVDLTQYKNIAVKEQQVKQNYKDIKYLEDNSCR